MPNPTTPEPITATRLESLGACRDAITRFREIFGESAPLTFDSAIANASAFDWDWAARALLSAPLRTEYKRAEALLWAEYGRAEAPLWAEYRRAQAPLWAEYKRAQAPLWAEYMRATAPLWAEYKRATAPLRAEYERAKARLFATLYLGAPFPPDPAAVIAEAEAAGAEFITGLVH